MTVQINMSGVASEIKKFAEGEALKVAAKYVKEQERNQSLSGRDFEGRFFAPYKKSTVADRRRKGYPTSRVTLTRTGGLAKSRYYDSSNHELKYGSGYSDIAGYLQDGTRNMKARPFVGVSVLDYPEIENRIAIAFNERFG